MNAVELIQKKQSGEELSESGIRWLIEGYLDGSVPDYQMSAWLMAVFFKGMTHEEAGQLTRVMIDSGEVMDLSELPGPLIDKHSTGGVGDKVSLILAPLAAACGVTVPMMSGRSLGHTGGTLDKLESIPGYRTDLAEERFRQCLQTVGFAMIGQTERIAPADKLLYALRDATATVSSIPLITASILSKKFAEGAEGFVFDVKAGSGAFMRTPALARELADSLCRASHALGKKATALITDMDQPLGNMIGNRLEVGEAVQSLCGEGPPDLMHVTLRPTAEMLIMGGVSRNRDEAMALCSSRLNDGAAFEKFRQNVELQGGDPRFLDRPDKWPRAAVMQDIDVDADGTLRRIDALQVGRAATLLGAGRIKKGDNVLPEVGIELLKKAGDRIDRGDTVCLIHAASEDTADRARQALHGAFTVGDALARSPSLILDRTTG